MGGKYWKRCRKVQELSATGERRDGPATILGPMRHRFAGLALAIALGAQSGVAQAPLTPADSAVLNSQPLKRLALAPSLFRRLSVLAAGLDREVVLCLPGTVVADTALLREFAMPDIVDSSVDAVTTLPCPAAPTPARLHN